jgi:hypothetical protein
MDDELARLEAERAQFVEFVRRKKRQTSLIMYLSFLIVGIVYILLVGAMFAGQLSLTGLFWSVLLVSLVFFVLSRRLRSGIRVGMVADLVFGGRARTDPEYFQAQVAKYDKRIASLKRAEKI